MTAPARPPLPWLLAYRLLGLRLPAEYRAWVAEDVASMYFLAWRIGRTTLWLWTLVCLYWFAQTTVYQSPARRLFYQFLLATLALSLLSSGKTLVRRTLRWQRVDKYGRPVEPRGLARLSNPESLVFGAAVLVFLVSGMSLFAYALRPAGAAGAPCRGPSQAVEARIRAGLKEPDAQLVGATAVTSRGVTTVLAVVHRPPGKTPQDRPHVWLVTESTVYELRTAEQAKESATTFEPPPNPERIGIDGLQRVVACHQKARGR